jgi:hypothetical protein
VLFEVCGVRERLEAPLIFGALGLVLAYLIVSGHAVGGDWWSIVVASGVAAFAVSYVLWRVIGSPARPLSARRGALAGALTGVLAHPVAWYLAIIWNYLRGRALFPGGTPVGPIEGLRASLVYAFFGLLLTGWLTVPAGAIAGWLLARRRGHQ